MPITNHRTTAPLYRLLNLKLADTEWGGLDNLVEARRGINRSWRKIADEVTEQTGESVSWSTLYEWYPELRPAP